MDDIGGYRPGQGVELATKRAVVKLLNSLAEGRPEYKVAPPASVALPFSLLSLLSLPSCPPTLA